MSDLAETIAKREQLEESAKEYYRLVNSAMRKDPPQWALVRLYGRKLTDASSSIIKLRARENSLRAWHGSFSRNK